MRETTPMVFLVARPSINWPNIRAYLRAVGGQSWGVRREEERDLEPDGDGWTSENAGQDLMEIMGRLCYRSWEAGLNANVTRTRADQGEYIDNILNVMHGSVLEHAHYSFIFHDVSRVFTHELVRHRHENISQESLRFVRLTDIPFWTPEWAQGDAELMGRNQQVLEVLEEHQRWLAEHFALDDDGVPFAEKKHKTSFMRRLAPIGLSTGIGWTANVRGLRHIIEMRTAKGAEEEIRLVFGQVAQIMRHECPDAFGDYEQNEEGEWLPKNRKV